MTIGDILDGAQEFLHDDGAVWPRAELLHWANDGYRQLLAQSHAVVRPFQLDVPGRTAWSGTQEWEDRHGEGTWRLMAYHVRAASISATFQWEAQTLEGISPTASTDAITHLWELYFASAFDQHCRLVLSKQHERPLKVYHDDKRILGASTKELDTLQTEWWQQQGDPIFWFPSSGGRDGSYEIYEIASAYAQSYDLRDADAGVPRLFSGDRTYTVESAVDRWDYSYSGNGDIAVVLGLGYRFTSGTDDATVDATFPWELDQLNDGTSSDSAAAVPVATAWWEDEIATTAEEISLGLGLVRGLSSADRQYTAAPYANSEFSTLGIARDFKSSVDAITIWEIIVSATELDEEDGLSLIPAQFAKYLKFYVLSRAFSRKGQGFRPDLAQHFTSLFQVGVALFVKIGNLGFIDRTYAREMVTPTRGFRPPQVQLPPEFERF